MCEIGRAVGRDLPSRWPLAVRPSLGGMSFEGLRGLCAVSISVVCHVLNTYTEMSGLWSRTCQESSQHVANSPDRTSALTDQHAGLQRCFARALLALTATDLDLGEYLIHIRLLPSVFDTSDGDISHVQDPC